MKAYVIYVKGYKDSERQAEKARASCYQTGFDAILLEGVTPSTLADYPDWPDTLNGRVTHFKQESMSVYAHKKSCFANHYRIWSECVKINEPIAFLEHDVGNARKWLDGTKLDDVLILNAESAFKQPVFNHVRNKPWLKFGTNTYDDSPLRYRFNNQWHGALMIPGTGAYIVTPKGAAKLLEALEDYGWEQSDFFINTMNVNLDYIVPEYFTFKSSNLNSSYGFEK